jgi:DNA-binding CsgD family transcriptional regulator
MSLSHVLERALDMLDYALVIVNQDGKLEYKNRVAAALLKDSPGPLGRAQLRAAIRLACLEARASGLFVARRGRPPWRVIVAPIHLGSPESGPRGAAIWIVDTQAAGLPAVQLLAVLFGLSQAEARLGVSLLAGRTPEECARHAGVGVATIRSQLHNIFAKTGVRRQAELVALLSKVPALQVARLSPSA